MLKTPITVFLMAVMACLSEQSAYCQIGPVLKKTGEMVVRKSLTIAKVVPEKEIARLAPLAKTPGRLGKEVGKLNLPELARADLFLQVAVRNAILDSGEEVAIREMGDVKGLASLLSKINSSNVNQARGHLKELQIGTAGQIRGGTVIAFGTKFGDGIKKGDTDLDILMKMNGKQFAIESKAYQSEIGTDIIRADLHSLKHFCSEVAKDSTPIFCFDKPPSELVQRVLQSENVDFLTGTGEEICTKLNFLAR